MVPKNLPKTINYFNNDETNQYFNIRTNYLNKILERKKNDIPYLIYIF